TAIPTPGHTRDSVSYFLEPGNVSASGALFTGDTLFLGGCGRLGECEPERMWESLRLLAAGAGEIGLYCGHEYTRENYRFAAAVGVAGREALDLLQDLDRRPEAISVPRTLEAEKRTNPFLRAHEPAVRVPLGMEDASAFEVFLRLRRLKDVF
ncbi:MAG TPA: hydroxyacylglutathione hydrolase C-terminal domain-containing protein, partial [bacterium]|nr:hydroxyacylglutathione hydrolase C-terminal domain-containing protein [bacterium]